jgi:hypothetical protein
LNRPCVPGARPVAHPLLFEGVGVRFMAVSSAALQRGSLKLRQSVIWTLLPQKFWT